jgi:hypothetical protein
MPASSFEFLSQFHGGCLGGRLQGELASGRWTSLDAAVAYVKLSGVRQIGHHLHAFAADNPVRMTVGIDQGGSSLEGVQTLWLVLGSSRSALKVLHNPGGNPSPTFHPKLWLFQNATEALLVCGSGNLTGGGLYSNYEAAVLITAPIADPAISAARTALHNWADITRPEIRAVDGPVLQLLHASGELPSEAASHAADAVARRARAFLSGLATGARATSGLFRPAAVPPPPPAVPLRHFRRHLSPPGRSHGLSPGRVRLVRGQPLRPRWHRSTTACSSRSTREG